MNLTRRYLADLAERMLRTFVQAYGATWAVTGFDFDHLLTVDNLKVAVAATILALLMGLGFKPVGNPESPSALPPELQPPAPIPADPDPEAPKVVAPPATAVALNVAPPLGAENEAWSAGYRQGLDDARSEHNDLDAAYQRGVEHGALATLKGLAGTPSATGRPPAPDAPTRHIPEGVE